MNKVFYPKLAAVGIRKNGRFYLPYLVICTAMTGMFYILCTLYLSKTLMRVSSTMFDILKIGCYFTAILSAIILFYTNSFIMKRRQKEIGLYNILGMEKKHIARIFLWETLMLFGGTLLAGLIFGLVFEKLVMLVLFKILHQAASSVQFEFSFWALMATVLEFGAVFFLNLLFNMIRVARAKPVELLHGGNVGEREPKTKWVMAILGLLSLGGGYAIAIVEKNPVKALALFFLAVLLVVLGTYLLFTAGSIALLKILRRNKKYYYKPKHFTSVSGMMYRMKQNAAGLASICILSTMVLVTVSTTVSLYAGLDDILDSRYAYDSDMVVYVNNTEQGNGVEDATLAVVKNTLSNSGLKLNNATEVTNLVLYGAFSGSEFMPDGSGMSVDDTVLKLIAADDYAVMTGDTTTISDNQMIVYSKSFQSNTLQVYGQTFTAVKRLSANPYADSSETYVENYCLVVVPEDAIWAVMDSYNHAMNAGKGEDEGFIMQTMSTAFYLDVNGSDAQILSCYADMKTRLAAFESEIAENNTQEFAPASVMLECRQESRDSFYAMYGGLLFLGLFLGTLFLLCAVLIIYFKQISEGYEDRRRFEIMRQVGMTRTEVKASIRSQVLMVFFLPILMAAVHLLAGFKMITRMLALMGLTNIGLFAVCVLATVAGYALIYTGVYLLTARVYYKIVSE